MAGPATGPAPQAKGGFDWRLLVQGLSSALPVIAQSRASRDAQDDLLQGQADLARIQREADTMIGDEVADLRGSGPEADESKALADYAAAASRARAQRTAPGPTLGGERFQADAKVADQQGQQYARQQATFSAGVDAPSRQRERETQRAARRGGDVKALGQDAGTAAFLSKLRAQRRTVNPWIALLSQLGGQISRNYVRPGEEIAGAPPAPVNSPRSDPFMTGGAGRK